MSKGHKEVMGSKNYTKEESPWKINIIEVKGMAPWTPTYHKQLFLDFTLYPN
jgi:hypothetical protein